MSSPGTPGHCPYQPPTLLTMDKRTRRLQRVQRGTRRRFSSFLLTLALTEALVLAVQGPSPQNSSQVLPPTSSPGTTVTTPNITARHTMVTANPSADGSSSQATATKATAHRLDRSTAASTVSMVISLPTDPPPTAKATAPSHSEGRPPGKTTPTSLWTSHPASVSSLGATRRPPRPLGSSRKGAAGSPCLLPSGGHLGRKEGPRGRNQSTTHPGQKRPLGKIFQIYKGNFTRPVETDPSSTLSPRTPLWAPSSSPQSHTVALTTPEPRSTLWVPPTVPVVPIEDKQDFHRDDQGGTATLTSLVEPPNATAIFSIPAGPQLAPVPSPHPHGDMQDSPNPSDSWLTVTPGTNRYPSASPGVLTAATEPTQAALDASVSAPSQGIPQRTLASPRAPAWSPGASVRTVPPTRHGSAASPLVTQQCAQPSLHSTVHSHQQLPQPPGPRRDLEARDAREQFPRGRRRHTPAQSHHLPQQDGHCLGDPGHQRPHLLLLHTADRLLPEKKEENSQPREQPELLEQRHHHGLFQ